MSVKLARPADDPNRMDRAGVHQRDLRQPFDLLGRGIAAVLGEDGRLAAQQAEVVEGLDARAAARGQHDDVAVELVEHPARRAAGVAAIVVQRQLLQAGRRAARTEPLGQVQLALPEHGVLVDLHLGVGGDPLAGLGADQGIDLGQRGVAIDEHLVELHQNVDRPGTGGVEPGPMHQLGRVGRR